MFRTLYYGWGKKHLKSTSIPSCRKCGKRFQNQFLKHDVSKTSNQWLAVATSEFRRHRFCLHLASMHSFFKLEDFDVKMAAMSQVRDWKLISICLKATLFKSMTSILLMTLTSLDCRCRDYF